MKILLTNDDGFYAQGITKLRKYLSKRAHVSTIAPLYEQSGTGHSITLYKPLRVRVVKEDGVAVGHAVEGTPADCVKIAERTILKSRPDIVISGINSDQNIGTSVIYSGTVSAAVEAAIMGICAVAVSLNSYKNPSYDYAVKFTWRLAKLLQRHGFPKYLLNVNIPNVPPSKIKGVKVVRQGMSRYIETFEKRRDPRQNIYYWLSGELVDSKPSPDSDYCAVKNGYISVTPLKFNLTDEKALAPVKKLFDGF
ncbi:MAG: 5'/3'-nucleotidase SurE [Elusimicrobia bacterium]|nr:5'/3'-nucleotidase SurE [Elusimicrobiota bacterium]